MSKFTVYNDKHGEFRWKFVGSSNLVVARSGEGFKKQEDCIASLNLVQKDIPGAGLAFQLRNGILPATAVKPAPAPVVVGAPAAPALAASPAIVPAQAPPPAQA
jgi:uncharacterized protein YegP (UPF0339 family)